MYINCLLLPIMCLINLDNPYIEILTYITTVAFNSKYDSYGVKYQLALHLLTLHLVL